MAEAPRSAPPPERQLITKPGGKSIYLSNTPEPWRIPADALVPPTGPHVGMSGGLALSDRFPDLMRGLFEAIDNHLRLPGVDESTSFRELIKQFPPGGMTFQQRRDWDHLLRVVEDPT